MKRFLLCSNSFFQKKLPAGVSDRRVFALSVLLPSLKRIGVVIIFLTSLNVYGQENNQQQQETYQQVIRERSAKIVNTLAITDSAKYNIVLHELMDQYFTLNTIHDQHKAAVAEIKERSLQKVETEQAIKKQKEVKAKQLAQRHTLFIAHLEKSLTEYQLEKVKDGMTYRVFPITYAGYEDMLTNLTAEQKNQIYTWLKEARELAMDEGSSEKKHQVFGKYKGKINNYLSAAGYDMKKESKAWQERIKEREAATKK